MENDVLITTDSHAAGKRHTQSAEQVLATLAVTPDDGLSYATATARLAQYGRNEIPEGAQRSVARMMLDQVTDFMILVLVAAAVISGLIGDVTDTIVIIAIVVLNAIVGFIQEFRAEAAITALRRMAAPQARVARDGRTNIVDAATIVPGDIVLLEAGNIVPADLRLIETHHLRVQEAALTGESAAVEKYAATVLSGMPPLGDRINMAYKGTVAVHGRARGVVVATGAATELGRIADLLRATETTQTPLQRRLASFGRVVAIGVVVLCALLFIVGKLHGVETTLMLLTALSLAVAAIPEALPAVVTVALALGARRMVQHHALIRRLPAVETLGSVTYICADKTGTLTQNHMRAERVCTAQQCRQPPTAAPDRDDALRELLHAMALNNDTRVERQGAPIGDPTEVALYECARDADVDLEALARQLPRIAELPFDATRRCMTTLHRRNDGGIVAYVKGSPEAILSVCANALGDNTSIAFDTASAHAHAEQLAQQGLRVLAFARRKFTAAPALVAGEVETNLTYLGLAGLIDPPREEATVAVAECISAGIVPVMITGDHAATAGSVAARLGILAADGEVLTGQDLEQLDDAALAKRVRHVRVYARVAPEQKIRIVRSLQERGEYVAMTGDGVNDAPALKRADIGVAMGITGTDVAKEAAHMVLLDDNFATIVRAVREGRRIFDNIRKFIRFVLTGNMAEIIVVAGSPLLGMPIALLPIHILWINLVTDGLPGLALTAEPAERYIMHRPPRQPDESLFAHGLGWHVMWSSSLIATLCLGVQWWAMTHSAEHWQTMVFTTLTLSQMFHVLAIRSERDSLWQQGVLSNKALLGSVVTTFLLQLALIYVPLCNALFRTVPLTVAELGICIAASSAILVAVECEKWLVRRGRLYARLA